ncbi:MAG: type II toxin-antitoxin system HicB family antitoxin [Candidatus Tectomicrobia bacterium]|nr:type II toxin-antitoxin system HicB family antitoxin [Candidatus Tectomicrobia bacterium]
MYRYIVVFEPAEEGGYVVRIPALPGVVTQGETLDEARSVARDAINGYLESLAKDGETGPIEEIREPLREVIEVAVA